MALKLDERYPGRANPASIDYPGGSFKNRTTPDSKDGMILEKDWANDFLGFFQYLLAKAGVTPSGQADTAQDSQYADALKSLVADWQSGALEGKADKTTQIIAGTGLTGGGSVAEDRTLSVVYGSTEDTAAQGDDPRIVNSVQTSGNQTIAGIKTFSSFPVTPPAAPTDDYQTANKKYVDDSALGVGQAWQDMTGSRSRDTWYTNTTGRVIEVSICFNPSSTNQTGAANVRNPPEGPIINVGAASVETYHFQSFAVPAGWQYRAVTPYSFWSELR